MKSVVILCLGVFGGAGALGLFHWLRPAAVAARTAVVVPNTAPRRNDADTAELQERVRQLAVEVAALREQDRAGPTPPAPASAEPQSEPANPIPNSEARALAEQEHAARIAEVEAAFNSQNPDPRWSSPMEVKISDAARNAKLTQGSLQKVQCHTDTCRVELKVQDPISFSREMPNLISALSDLRGSAMDFVEDPRGGHTGILYLFR